MGVARPRFADTHEVLHVMHQAFHRRMSMIASYGVVHGFPQPLDFIDPRVIDRLKLDLPGIGRHLR